MKDTNLYLSMYFINDISIILMKNFESRILHTKDYSYTNFKEA